MIWTDAMKARAHTAVEGASSYTYQDLYRRFGRLGFDKVNETANAYFVGPWSADGGTTKSYKLSPMYREIKRNYVKRMAAKIREAKELSSGSFIDMAGRKFATVPKSIASKREDGSPVKLWGDVEFTSAVPVNTWQLEKLYKQTWEEIKQLETKRLSGGLFAQHGEVKKEKLELRAEWAATLLVLANTDLGGRGWLPMRYRESQSGRLYAMDDNLQNCPGEVRRHALDGCYDYDIENCHYTLLAQLAARYDIPCPAIHDYLQNKSMFRQSLAEYVSSSVEDIKTCLLALIYGTKLSSGPFDAIGKTLGKEKASKLLEMPAFARLAKEVKIVGGKLLECWPERSGSLINDAGCGIKRAANNRQKLSHLLQGAEALVLKACVEYLEARRQGNVILLQHDGFTTRERIEIAPLETHIEAETGYSVKLEEKRIQPTADRDFSKMTK